MQNASPSPYQVAPAQAKASSSSNWKNVLFSGKQTPLKKGLLFVVGLLIIGFIFRTVFKPATITVVGEGKVSFEADEVSMVATRVNAGDSATAAINEGEAGIKVLIDAAKSVGGPETEVQKAFYQVQPTQTSRGTTYQVANAFSLKFSDASKTNEMIKTLYTEGASSVTGVSFSSTKKDKISQDARKMAVKNAKDMAKDVARSTGKRLGRVVAIADDNQEAFGTVSGENSGDTDFGSVSVTKTVSIVYEIW